MKVQPYDFCKPERMLRSEDRLASDMEQSLARWLRDMSALAPKAWSRHLPFRVEMKAHELETLSAAAALSQLDESTIGYRIPLQTVNERPSLLVLPRPLVLALVGGMLGDVPGELPVDREFSAVEESLCEYLVHDLLLPCFQETWLGAEPLQLGIIKREPNPKWSRVFLPNDTILRCVFTIQGPFGEQCWFWLVLQSALIRLFGAEPEGASRRGGRQEPDDVPGRLVALVRQMRVELVVELGSVELPLAMLGNLRPGDVVVLDQRVNDPLPVTIAGIKKFLGWPGRSGTRQVVQIEAIQDS